MHKWLFLSSSSLFSLCVISVCTQDRQSKHTHTCLTALFLGLPGWAGTRKVKTNVDFTVARDSEWQWHQLGHMQVCTSLQTDNYASNPPLSFLQAGCPSCRPTNSVEALKGWTIMNNLEKLLSVQILLNSNYINFLALLMCMIGLSASRAASDKLAFTACILYTHTHTPF